MQVPSSHRRWLGPSGLYPQKHVTIVWNADPAVVEVEVILSPREALTDEPEAPWSGFEDYVSEWDFVRGNTSSDWLTTEAHIYCRESDC